MMARLDITATSVIVRERLYVTEVYSFLFNGSQLVLDSYQKGRKGNAGAKIIICKKYHRDGLSNTPCPEVPEDVLNEAKQAITNRLDKAFNLAKGNLKHSICN